MWRRMLTASRQSVIRQITILQDEIYLDQVSRMFKRSHEMFMSRGRIHLWDPLLPWTFWQTQRVKRFLDALLVHQSLFIKPVFKLALYQCLHTPLRSGLTLRLSARRHLRDRAQNNHYYLSRLRQRLRQLLYHDRFRSQ